MSFTFTIIGSLYHDVPSISTGVVVIFTLALGFSISICKSVTSYVSLCPTLSVTITLYPALLVTVPSVPIVMFPFSSGVTSV